MRIPNYLAQYFKSLPHFVFSPKYHDEEILETCLENHYSISACGVLDTFFVSIQLLKLLLNKSEKALWLCSSNERLNDLLSDVVFFTGFNSAVISNPSAVQKNIEDFQEAQIFFISQPENIEVFSLKKSFKFQMVVVDFVDLFDMDKTKLVVNMLNRVRESFAAENLNISLFTSAFPDIFESYDSLNNFSKRLEEVNLSDYWLDTTCRLISSNTVFRVHQVSLVECNFRNVIEDSFESRSSADKLIYSMKSFLSNLVYFFRFTAVSFSDVEDSNLFADCRAKLYSSLSILEELGPWCCMRISICYTEQLDILVKGNRGILRKFIQMIRSTLRTVISFYNQYYQSYVANYSDFMELLPVKLHGLRDVLYRFKPPQIQLDSLDLSNQSLFDANEIKSAVLDGLDDDSDFSDDDTKDGPVISELPDHEQTQIISENSANRKEKSRKNPHVIDSAEFFHEMIKSDDCALSEIESDLFRGILFVNNSLYAYLLSEAIDALCSWDEDLYFVRPRYLHKVTPGLGVNDSRFKLTLAQFDSGFLNFLIVPIQQERLLSSSFIKSAKLSVVVMWVVPESFSQYYYCRNRVDFGSYVILIESEEERNKVHFFQNIEKTSLKYNISKAKLNYIECLYNNRLLSRDGLVSSLHFDNTNSLGLNLSDFHKPSVTRDDLDKLEPPLRFCAREGLPLTLSFSKSIHLLNLYCARLPSDTYTKLVPKFTMKKMSKTDPSFIACVHLPSSSWIRRPILSKPCASPYEALLSAAFESCKMLHSVGDITDNMEPVGSSITPFVSTLPKQLKLLSNFGDMNNDLEVLYNSFGGYSETRSAGNQTDDGSLENFLPLSRVRSYEKYFPECLAAEIALCSSANSTTDSAFALSNNTSESYLYHIDIKLTYPLPEIINTRERILYDSAESPYAFGLILGKKLPEVLPPFTVYTRSGEETVSFNLLSSINKDDLSSHQVKLLQQFHEYVFSNVLWLKHSNSEYDYDSSRCKVVVSPLKKTLLNSGCSSYLDIIDWRLINKVLNASPPDLREMEIIQSARRKAKLLAAERKQNSSGFHDEIENVTAISSGERASLFQPFIFDRSRFEDVVVAPLYRREEKPQFFFVGNIRDDLNPLSSFPSDKYDTFVSYYDEKYGIEITNETQPLLDVDRAPMRLNLLTPRFLTHKGSVLCPADPELRRERKESLRCRQLLIPELCTIHAFPASFWRQAVVLPSVLFRLTYICIAEELRMEIAVETGVGRITFLDDFKFEKFDLGIDVETILHENLRAENALASCVEIGKADEKRLTNIDICERTLIEKQENSKSQNEEVTVETTDSRGKIDKNNPTVKNCEEKRFEKNSKIDQSYAKQDCLQDTQLTHKPTCLSDVIPGTCTCFNADQFSSTELALESSPSKSSSQNSQNNDFRIKWRNKFSIENEKSIDSCLNFELNFDFSVDSSSYTGPSPGKILECLTTMNAGDFINLERLEMIGDSFLKYSVSTFYFCRFPTAREGQLSFLRSQQISNTNLFRIGLYKGLGERLIADRMEPNENWLPPGYNISTADSIHNVTLRSLSSFTHQTLKDKSLADCVEALIGCYLIEGGEEAAIKVMQWLGITVALNLSVPLMVTNSNDIFVPQNSEWEEVFSVNDLYEKYHFSKFEDKIQYQFKNRALLLQALTHISYHYNTLTDCYQRLEFLGDAILDYVITRCVFEDPRKHSPGVLTDLRSALVNNTVFAALACVYEFQQYFLCLSSKTHFVIRNFLKRYRSDLFSADFNWQELDGSDQEIPKCLGDIFESVAGAIYLDSDCSLNTVWTVYKRMMHPLIDEYLRVTPMSAIRELGELEPTTTSYSQAERTSSGQIKITVTVAEVGEFDGVGVTYHLAKSNAARNALNLIKKCSGQ